MMKKMTLLILALCLVLTGCGKKEEAVDASTQATEKETVETAPAASEQQPAASEKEPAHVINPLPDSTMDNLTDAILAVSLEEGGAYVDDTGKMQMDVKIYTYDKYDMVDIAQLKVGDIIVTHAGEVEVTSLEENSIGIIVNGGLEEGGFDLVTDDSGIYFETGFNDAKNWYEVGEATIRVSADFEGHDMAAPDKGDVILYPGSFLVGEVTNYNFVPHNTTIRVEEGQIVEMTRTFMP